MMNKVEAFKTLCGGQTIWHPSSGIIFYFLHLDAVSNVVISQIDYDRLEFEEGYELYR